MYVRNFYKDYVAYQLARDESQLLEKPHGDF